MKSKRRKNDFYPTLASNTEALLKHVVVSGVVLEACSGEHHITKVLTSHNLEVITNDIDRNFEANFHFDAKTSDLYKSCQADWFITNPPFNQAFEILTAAHEHFDNIALYLRISFLEPTFQRGEWLSNNPPNKIIYLPRTSHTGDGNTDSVTCAWMVWQKNSKDKEIVVVSKGKK